MNVDINGHPIEIAIGPPLFQACEKVVKQPDNMEMAENEIAKLENPDQFLFSSCLYPNDASRRSSWEMGSSPGSPLPALTDDMFQI